jgi:hypothetical protein
MGLMPNVFWNLTYAEFYAIWKGHRKREIKRHNELVLQAWQTAYFLHPPEDIKLEDFLLKDEPEIEDDDEYTPEESLAYFRMLNAAYGGAEVKL